MSNKDHSIYYSTDQREKLAGGIWVYIYSFYFCSVFFSPSQLRFLLYFHLFDPLFWIYILWLWKTVNSIPEVIKINELLALSKRLLCCYNGATLLIFSFLFVRYILEAQLIFYDTFSNGADNLWMHKELQKQNALICNHWSSISFRCNHTLNVTYHYLLEDMIETKIMVIKNCNFTCSIISCTNKLFFVKY